MLSQTTRYALRAIAFLARQPEGDFRLGREIAGATRVPPHYLSKLLQSLSRAGVLESRKGLGGGFRLARPPERILLLSVVQPIENVSKIGQCLLGDGRCTPGRPCQMHRKWRRVATAYLDFLEHTTVADVAHAASKL